MMAIVISGVLAFGQLRAAESFPQSPLLSVSQRYHLAARRNRFDEAQRIEESISGISQASNRSPVSRVLISGHGFETSSTDLDKLLDDIRNQVDRLVYFSYKDNRPQVVRNEFTNLAAFVAVQPELPMMSCKPMLSNRTSTNKKNPAIQRIKLGTRTSQSGYRAVDPHQTESVRLSLEDLAELVGAKRSLETRSGELISDKGLNGDS